MMNYSKQFPAHLPAIDLALIPIPDQRQQAMAPAPAFPEGVAFTWLAATENKVTAAHAQDLGATHEVFLEQQARIYQAYLNQHQLLMQQWFAPSLSSIPETVTATTLPGPKFSRADLETLASRAIAPLFGEWFQPLDQYAKLIRMPEPPLLLTDRVTGIDGIQGSMKTGTIWTETTVTEDAWYLHQGRMPAGIMIESGQSDLLLASWLGFDFYNRGQRVYRLLGCELTYTGPLPQPGETLCYEIHIDGHARQGEVIIFFFHYDCYINGELRLKVREGQAGFFSLPELNNSGGVLWDAEKVNYSADLPHDAPILACQQTAFSHAQLQAFAAGKLSACFGPAFKLADCHTRTPRISAERMLLIDEVTHFDPQGGPLRRGYMRATQAIHADDWFFKGHFKNDPCMPGTLMFEAALQVMACYLTALGYSIDKDGWRFEPVADETYKMRCRGQVTPTSKEVVYEIFVYSVEAGPIPTLFADILCTADGLKAFHTRCGLKLVPDWPLTKAALLPEHVSSKPVAEVHGFKFDYASLVACALGKPSSAFGEFYAGFDNHRRVPRLPAPPYHFMSRITEINGEMGCFKPHVQIECEYDIPTDAWYFADNVTSVMPFCVLLEIGLQPCGWLASFLGSTLVTPEDLLFRNLEGVATLHRLVDTNTDAIRTRVLCKSISQSAGMIIESFKVQSFTGEQLIYEMDTTFGFFPPQAFAKQAGLAVLEDEKDILTKTSDFYLQVATLPRDYYSASVRLPASSLLMIDTITGFWPQQGKNGLGRMRGEKKVVAADWFFKAHFFQDPVQPGSLGVEAMIQLLQLFAFQQGWQQRFNKAQCLPLLEGCQLSWKYRGQVTPNNDMVTVIIDVVAIDEKVEKVTVIADASLWVDGKKIYSANQLGLVICEDKNATRTSPSFHFDPRQDQWLNDHCPNYILPTLPMMSMVDLIATAALPSFPAQKIVRMQDIRALDWLIMQEPTTIQTDINVLDTNRANVTLYTYKNKQRTHAAVGTVVFKDQYPIADAVVALLDNPQAVTNPYDNLFHGEAFHYLEILSFGDNGATAILNPSRGTVPLGAFNQGLLDSLTHTIPHDHLSLWCPDIPSDQVGYPAFIPLLEFFMDDPGTAKLRCETRFKGFYHHKQFPQFEMSVWAGEKLWLKLILVDALFPKGKLGDVAPVKRRAFLRDKHYVPEMRLSQVDQAGHAYLAMEDVKRIDWLPGSLAQLYDISGDLESMTRQILWKETLAEQLQVHPSAIRIHKATDCTYAVCKLQPDKSYRLNELQKEGERFMLPSF